VQLASQHRPIRRESPSQQDARIRMALLGARAVDRVMPVLDPRGKVAAWVCGAPWWARDRRPMWAPARPGDRAHPLQCGFTTYDDLIAETSNAGKMYRVHWSKGATTAPVASNWYDLWPVGGTPVAGTYPGAARVATQWSDTSTGAMWCHGNVSTDTKHVLYGYGLSSAAQPTLLFVYDRVLTYEACAFSTSNQTMTNGVAAQRYISAGQPALKVMTTCQTALGATASTFTQLRYTDQDGNTLQSIPTTAPNNVIVSAAAPTATLGARIVHPSASGATLTAGPFMQLAAGDGGVRLINDFTCSGANTGTLAFVLMHPIAWFPLTGTAGVPVMLDFVMQLAGLERIYDGACLAHGGFWAAATAATVSGHLQVGWG